MAKTFGIKKDVWSISAKWSSKIIDCTQEGIQHCNAECCGAPFWPGRAGAGSKCFYLKKDGCSLEPYERPIACLLFPLRLNDLKKMVLFGGTLLKTSPCFCNYKRGGVSILRNLEKNFYLLFGEKTSKRIIESVESGHDCYFKVPKLLAEQYITELDYEKRNKTPLPRERIFSSRKRKRMQA